MAADGFLELVRADGGKVEGEALDQKFAKTIAIDDFTMKAAGTEKKKEKEKHGKEGEKKSKGKLKCPITFKIGKAVDSSSPYLYLSYCIHCDQEDTNDKPFAKARVTLRKSDGGRAMVYLVFEFEDVFVTDYSLKTDESKLPTESVSFTCNRCCITYHPQRLNSSKVPTYGGWDFLTGSDWTPTKG